MRGPAVQQCLLACHSNLNDKRDAPPGRSQVDRLRGGSVLFTGDHFAVFVDDFTLRRTVLVVLNRRAMLFAVHVWVSTHFDPSS